MNDVRSWNFKVAGGAAQTGQVERRVDGVQISCGLTVTGDTGVTVAASVSLYGTNRPADPNSWRLVATFNATGTTTARDEIVAQANWDAYRADVTGLTGTNAVADFTLSAGR